MIRLAVLGTGFIAGLFMDTAAPKLEGYTVTAVLGIDEKEAQAFAGRYGIPAAYTDYERLLADPEIDFVYIGLPNFLHFSYALRALEAGKNVIVEKPFVSQASEVDILLAEAKKRGKMIFDAVFTRYVPTMQALQDNLSKIGKISQVTTTYCQYSSRFDAVRAGEIPGAFDLAKDGGALKDLGIYSIQFLTTLFGRPESVRYYADKLPNGCDAGGVLVMQYKDFCATSILAKDCCMENRCVIAGQDGTLFVDDDCFRFPNLRLRRSKKDAGETLAVLEESGMVCEFRRFQEIYEAKDFAACYRYLEKTRIAVDVLACAAQLAGIVYGSNKKSDGE